MKSTVVNQLRMKEVMADLREEGARCCLIYTGYRDRAQRYPDDDVHIRAVLKDGRIWNIPEIRTCCDTNEAIVVSAIE